MSGARAVGMGPRSCAGGVVAGSAQRPNHRRVADEAASSGESGGARPDLPRVRPVVLLAVVAVVVAGFALHAARVVLIPLTFALFLAVVLWPVQRWMLRRMPRWAAVAGMSAAMLLIAAAVVLAIAGLGAMAARNASSVVSQVWTTLESVRSWAEQRGLPADWMPERAATQAGGEQDLWHGISPETMRRIVSFLTSGLGATIGLFGMGVLTLYMTVLALAEAPSWRERLGRVYGEARMAAVTDAFEECALQFRRYLWATTVAGILAGIATGLLCWMVGVPMAVLWGVLAWLLNYIPNIGIFISAIVPTALAFAHAGPGGGLAFLAGIIVIEAITGNVIQPLMTGHVTNLSTLVVMVALVFWGWIWGAPGALLAAPIMTATIIVMRRIEATRRMGELLNDEEGKWRAGPRRRGRRR